MLVGFIMQKSVGEEILPDRMIIARPFVSPSTMHYEQGYFIAKPMPAENLPGWIQEWKARVREELSAGA